MNLKNIVAATLIAASAVPAFGSVRLALPATGSTAPVHTAFTSPAENPAEAMNISWATDTLTPVSFVEYTTGADSIWRYARVVFPGETRRVTAFDSINSKLADNTDVYERHIFDKHGATLSNLSPDTDYRFRVVALRDGKRQPADERRFKTAGATSWKAAVIGDFHHYSPLWSRLDNATAMVDVLDSVAGGIDWILSTGDQTAWGASYNYWTELAEQPMYKNFTWGAVEGNHDHWAREKKDYSDEYFRNTHFNPMNGYKGQEGIVYWFKWGDVLFVMLNNEAMRNQATLETALEWMETVIKDNPAKYIVVVQHYEWLIGTNGANSQLDRFAETFDRLGVDLALSGNNHVYLRTYPLFERKPVEDGRGTVYVVNSSSDNSRGRDLKPLEANEDIIALRWSEGPKTVGGMVLDVNPSRMILTLHDRTGAPVDSVTIPARR